MLKAVLIWLSYMMPSFQFGDKRRQIAADDIVILIVSFKDALVRVIIFEIP